jgi:hypothetical protein
MRSVIPFELAGLLEQPISVLRSFPSGAILRDFNTCDNA